MLDERLGRWNFWTMFVGFNLGFFPMHITGLLGMPRRVYTYAAGMGWNWLNLITTLGSFAFAIGVLIFIANVVISYRRGRIAGDNPWDAPTLEWATSSPPPSYNFARIPVVNGANPLWEQPEELFVAIGLRVDRRELVVTSMAAAQPEAREASPRNSIWPLLAAIATTVELIWSIFSPWAIVWGSIPVAITLIGWFWPKPVPEDES
jgi:cytochrome c oxidase subunit 1